jgi:NADPH-dependent 2,4-dienoyl-CoA reductase/sulfur reductase-like enzyme
VRRRRFDVLVVATGAYDRPVPLPGWTLPGVVTAGAAHTLAKAHGITPGRRIVVAGSGPFLLPVGDVLSEHGSAVEIVEATPFSVSLRGLRALVRDPEVLLQAGGYLGRLTARRARRSYGQGVTAIHGDHRVEAVTIEKLDDNWSPIAGTARIVPADGVCLGFGFVPQLELAQLLGCRIGYRADSSDFHVVVDSAQRTSRDGVYAAGEVTGTAGVRVARSEGQLAGLAAALDAGLVTAARFDELASRIRRRLSRLEGVAEWVRLAYRPRSGIWALARPSTIVCRCEDVPLEAVAHAVESNEASPIAAKSVTRAGMGLCQGRICSPYLVEWLRSQRGFEVPGDAWPWSVRPPIRPVPLGQWASMLASGDP